MMKSRISKRMYDSAADGGAQSVTVDYSSVEQPDGDAVSAERNHLPEVEQQPEAPQNSSFDIENLKEEMKSELEETLKKQSMTEDERVAYELQKREEAIAAREDKLAKEQLRMDTVKLLSDTGLSQEIADVVLGGDVEQTKENIQKFKAALDVEVQKQVLERMRGKTPSAGNVAISAADSVRAQFAQGLR